MTLSAVTQCWIHNGKYITLVNLKPQEKSVPPLILLRQISVTLSHMSRIIQTVPQVIKASLGPLHRHKATIPKIYWYACIDTHLFGVISFHLYRQVSIDFPLTKLLNRCTWLHFYLNPELMWHGAMYLLHLNRVSPCRNVLKWQLNVSRSVRTNLLNSRFFLWVIHFSNSSRCFMFRYLFSYHAFAIYIYIYQRTQDEYTLYIRDISYKFNSLIWTEHRNGFGE